jgi:hypothetical protein
MFNVFFLNVLYFAMWMCEVSYYVRYFFVFVVICYVHVSDAYCLLCFNYSCIVLYGLDCMLQSSFDLDEFNIQSGFYG